MRLMHFFFIGMGVCVLTAPSADGAARIYFSTVGLTQELYDGQDDELLTVYPDVSNPVLPEDGGRLYIWMEMNREHNGPNLVGWHIIDLNVRTTGSAEILAAHTLQYRYDDGAVTYQRWEGVGHGQIGQPRESDPAGTNQVLLGMFMVAIGGQAGVNSFPVAGEYDFHFTGNRAYGADPGPGIGGPGGSAARDINLPEATLLGYVDVQGAGNVYFGVGQQRVFRSGGKWDWLAFGADDAYVRGREGNTWTDNPTADAVILPEPSVGPLAPLLSALVFARGILRRAAHGRLARLATS